MVETLILMLKGVRVSRSPQGRRGYSEKKTKQNKKFEKWLKDDF